MPTATRKRKAPSSSADEEAATTTAASSRSGDTKKKSKKQIQQEAREEARRWAAAKRRGGTATTAPASNPAAAASPAGVTSARKKARIDPSAASADAAAGTPPRAGRRRTPAAAVRRTPPRRSLGATAAVKTEPPKVESSSASAMDVELTTTTAKKLSKKEELRKAKEEARAYFSAKKASKVAKEEEEEGHADADIDVDEVEEVEVAVEAEPIASQKMRKKAPAPTPPREKVSKKEELKKAKEEAAVWSAQQNKKKDAEKRGRRKSAPPRAFAIPAPEPTPAAEPDPEPARRPPPTPAAWQTPPPAVPAPAVAAPATTAATTPPTPFHSPAVPVPPPAAFDLLSRRRQQQPGGGTTFAPNTTTATPSVPAFPKQTSPVAAAADSVHDEHESEYDRAYRSRVEREAMANANAVIAAAARGEVSMTGAATAADGSGYDGDREDLGQMSPRATTGANVPAVGPVIPPSAAPPPARFVAPPPPPPLQPAVPPMRPPQPPIVGGVTSPMEQEFNEAQRRRFHRPDRVAEEAATVGKTEEEARVSDALAHLLPGAPSSRRTSEVKKKKREPFLLRIMTFLEHVMNGAALLIAFAMATGFFYWFLSETVDVWGPSSYGQQPMIGPANDPDRATAVVESQVDLPQCFVDSDGVPTLPRPPSEGDEGDAVEEEEGAGGGSDEFWWSEYHFPPLALVTRGVTACQDPPIPCPDHGRCAGGYLRDCLADGDDDPTIPPLFVPSDAFDSCVLSPFAEGAVDDVSSAVIFLTVEQTCQLWGCRMSLLLGGGCSIPPEEVVKSVTASKDKDGVRVDPHPPMFTVKGVVDVLNASVTEDEEEPEEGDERLPSITANLVSKLVPHFDSDIVAYDDGTADDANSEEGSNDSNSPVVPLLGLTPHYFKNHLPLPYLCYARLLLLDLIFLAFGTGFFVVSVLVKTAWFTFRAYPLPSVIISAMVYLLHWIRKTRRERREMRALVYEVREMAHDKLVACDDGEGYASLFLRDDLAHELHPTSLRDRKWFIQMVWPKVANEIRLDNRVRKVERTVGGKKLEHWEWISIAGKKSRRSTQPLGFARSPLTGQRGRTN